MEDIEVNVKSAPAHEDNHSDVYRPKMIVQSHLRRNIVIGLVAVLLLIGVVASAHRPVLAKTDTSHFIEPAYTDIVVKLMALHAQHESGATVMNALQAKIDAIADTNRKLEVMAASYDTILCAQYGIEFRRTPHTNTGTIVHGCGAEASSVPLQ